MATQEEEEKEKDSYRLTKIIEEEQVKKPTLEECREIISSLKCGKGQIANQITKNGNKEL